MQGVAAVMHLGAESGDAESLVEEFPQRRAQGLVEPQAMQPRLHQILEFLAGQAIAEALLDVIPLDAEQRRQQAAQFGGFDGGARGWGPSSDERGVGKEWGGTCRSRWVGLS